MKAVPNGDFGNRTTFVRSSSDRECNSCRSLKWVWLCGRYNYAAPYNDKHFKSDDCGREKTTKSAWWGPLHQVFEDTVSLKLLGISVPIQYRLISWAVNILPTFTPNDLFCRTYLVIIGNFFSNWSWRFMKCLPPDFNKTSIIIWQTCLYLSGIHKKTS